MKYFLAFLFVLAGIFMLYYQVRVHGVMFVAQIVIAVNLFYSAVWLWGAQDIVLFKRSKSQNSKTKL